MPVLSSQASLVTVAEADAVLADTTAWTNLGDDVKQQHLLKGSLWMRTRYVCANVDLASTTNLPAVIKEAAILLALESVQGNLYAGDAVQTITGTVKKEMLKAGPVTQQLEYEAGTAKVDTGVDPYPFVTDLLSGVCVFDELTTSRKGGTFSIERS